MKISFANNPAVIGNIGTGTNNAWRVLWNQGIVQPGSSGSPLFDMVSHKVIGQLYSGTQPVGPPCNVQTGGTNYGRFDISWTGGGTKATRLKDWLDPGNSGAITTNTTNVSLLSPAFDASTLNINGPDLICNYSDYTVSNLPPGAVVTWSIPSSAGSVLQLSPNTPSANALRITNMRWYGVSTTLTATITNLPCGASQTRTKIVANDNNTTSTPLSPYYQEACLAGNVNHPSQSGSTSGATFVHQGCMVYVNLGDMIGRTITFTGATAPLTWGFGTTAYYQNTLYFILPLGSGGIPFSWKVSGTGACFESNYLFFSYSNNGRYAFAAMPNPAKDILTISAKENEDLLLQTKSKSANEELHFIMNIYDINTNILQITKSSNIGSLKHSINISKLKTGYYVLQIVEDDQSHTIKFFKE